MAMIMDIAPPPKPVSPKKWRIFRAFLLTHKWALGLGLAGLGLLILIGLVFVWGYTAGHSPVPAAMRKDVPFPVYYPAQNKLPVGYRLDTSSFHIADPEVLIYSVMNTNGQQLVFSEEQSPGDSVINKFTANAIPLHTVQTTKLGQAEFGAYGNGQNVLTVVSLPISKGPWLIITAPQNIGQSDLQKIVVALRK